jgi:hypothetical protein
MKRITICILLFYSFYNILFGQNDLSIFDEFVGSSWTGNYQNSEDSLIVHFIEWKFDLAKHLVIQSKKVPELNFLRDTYFFIDMETGMLSFLTFMNKDLVSKGRVTAENNIIILNGITYFDSGKYEFKQSFKINENGCLEDFFFRKTNGKWKQGHFIKYTKR